MTGQLVKHCSLKGIRKSDISADLFREVFSVKEVKEVRVTRKGILEEETRHIEVLKAKNPDALLLNTQKNTALTKKTKSTIASELSDGIPDVSTPVKAPRAPRKPRAVKTSKPEA